MTPDRIGDIHITREGHVAQVTIRKPPHNMMSIDLARDLADALEALDREPNMRAVVLASEGKSFCAGADLSNRAENIGPATPTSNPLYEQAVRLHATELPIVAAIQGAAVGAGLGLALIADLRIAAQEARFAANFVKIGFHPGFGLTHTLPRLIGRQRAALMFLTGRRIKAEEAKEWGLVDEVVYADRVLPDAIALANEIAENAPLAVRSTRKTLRAGLADAVKAQTDHEFSEQQWQMKTADFKEGVKAVSERRPGNFTGK
ncbi:MAG: enoyl-CoA hydratase/isomerase family protein [Alphaproteobacteria bacterium]|nr:enoyl-CoA hydratase/isomerase family protein [Alphaproteobacteria bacterium]